MKKTVAFLLLIALIALAFMTIMSGIQDKYYDGMMSYCLYVPYAYIDDKPYYNDTEGCREIVDDARLKGIYFNPRPLMGPGIEFIPTAFPKMDG